MANELYDLLVVGGGINGVGVARDAAGRGLKVLLCEQADLGWATSSASTKLIHGGLRYLEHYAFGLVRESLKERELLLRAAPHLVRSLRFVLPHDQDQRPAWMIRAGLFLYDHLSRRRIMAGSSRLNLAEDPLGRIMHHPPETAFAYSDCQVDDSRLVIVNAVDAAARGAEILTRTACTAAQRKGDRWQATLRDAHAGYRLVEARVMVNLAGPWVNRFLSDALSMPAKAHGRLIKGSHMVLPRLYDDPRALLLQNDDGRVVFVIPYQERFSLIGTTEVEHPADPKVETITDQELAYLSRAVQRYLAVEVDPAQAVWTFSGLRPLFDDAHASASAVTRDFRLQLDAPPGAAPLLTVFGGKLTTYRKLAEEVLAKLKRHLPSMGRPWTHRAVLPGGELEGLSPDKYAERLCAERPWLPLATARRYAHSYGSRAEMILGQAQCLEDLGRHLGDGLNVAEVRYLRRHEWARTARDILWRRTKLGLHAKAATVENLEVWLTTHPGPEDQGDAP